MAQSPEASSFWRKVCYFSLVDCIYIGREQIYLFVSFGVGWIVAFQHPPAAFSDISLAALIILVYWCAFRYSMHRAWKKNLELHGEVSGLLNDAGIEWNKSISSTKFPWNKLWYFKEVPEMIVVFYSRRCGFYFPKKFFVSNDSWSAFRQIVATKLARK